jgi:hypothetical protein
MRTAALALLVALVGVLASESALAHGRGRVSIGVGFGFGYPYWGWGPYWGPWYYPPPYYYPPAAVYVPAQPTTYIEQGGTPAADAGGWWYYCDISRGYYPYVKECPSGWQRVPPAPPPAR